MPNFLKVSSESHVFPSKSILSWSLVTGNQLNPSKRKARVLIAIAGAGIFHFFLPLASATIVIKSFQLESCGPPKW